MLSYLSDIVKYYSIDVIKLILVCWGIMGIPFHKKKPLYIITIAGMAAAILLLGILDKSREQQPYFTALMVLFTISAIFEGKILKRIFTSLLVYISVLFLDACLSGVISLIFNITFDEIMESEWIEMIANSLNVLTFGIITLIKRLYFKKSHTIAISKRIYAMLFAGAGTGIILVASLMAIENSGNKDRITGLMLAVTIIACITYFSICLFLVFLNESRNNYRMLSQINQTIIDAQQNYYNLAGEKQREIRSIRHEMKNHLACLKGLYQIGKEKELGEYLNQLAEETNQAGELLDCGNDIVNAVINDAVSRFSSEGIVVRTEGRFPSDLYIASTDLCVIFANAVTNAVEAIRRLKKQPGSKYTIDIKINSFKNDLYIDIRNPISGGIEIQEGRPVTTKPDRTQHGYGTENMKQRVEKYRGTISFVEENGMFVVHIFMKNS